MISLRPKILTSAIFSHPGTLTSCNSITYNINHGFGAFVDQVSVVRDSTKQIQPDFYEETNCRFFSIGPQTNLNSLAIQGYRIGGGGNEDYFAILYSFV